MAFENVFKGIDWQAQERAKNQQQGQFMQALGMGIAQANRKEDRDILNRQQEVKNAEAQAKAAQDYEQVAMNELNNISMGQAPTQQGQAAIDVMKQTAKSQVYFDQGGNQVVQPSPWNSAGGFATQGINPQAMSPYAINESDLMGSQGYSSADAGLIPRPDQTTAQQNIDALSQPAMQMPDMGGAPIIQAPVGSSPLTIQKTAEGNIQLQKDMALKKYEFDINKATSSLKTKEGKGKVNGILNRMGELNDLLKSEGSIISEDMPLNERAATYLATTNIGQQGRKVMNPKVQAYAEEYTKLQSTLLPFYASAAGLGAKSIDSDGERKAILGSFGDPSGIYEANQSQINNLNKLFGITGGDTPNNTPQSNGGWSIKKK